jgi:hypothetical protein
MGVEAVTSVAIALGIVAVVGLCLSLVWGPPDG